MSKLKRQFKYPEIPKFEREIDAIVKFLNENKISIDTLLKIVDKLQQQGNGSGITIIGSKNPPTNSDKFIFQDSNQSYNYVTITWQQLKSIIDENKGLVGTKEVDESAIGNAKILMYNSTSQKLEYIINNDGLVGTKEVDETNIGNDKIIVFDSTLNKLKYEDKPTSSSSPVIGNTISDNLVLSTSYTSVINKSSNFSIGDLAMCEVYGRIYNNTGASRNYTTRIDFGGNLLTLNQPSSLATSGYTVFRAFFSISILSTSTSIITGYITQFANSGSGVSVTTTGGITQGWLNIAADMTGSNSINILIASNGTGTQNFSGSAIIQKFLSV